MHINHVFELSMMVDTEKFQKVLAKAYNHQLDYIDDNKLVDQSLADKGIVISYHDKQYKKKVQLTVRPNIILDGDAPDKENITRMVRKLEKRVDDYFGSRYGLDDFTVTDMTLTTDINVHDHHKVSAYIKVLRRIGRVKGFSPPNVGWIGDDISFCLDGNSNGIAFMAYDLEGLLRKQMEEDESKRKQLNPIAKKAVGLLRTCLQ